jgi:hypothetical protein
MSFSRIGIHCVYSGPVDCNLKKSWHYDSIDDIKEWEKAKEKKQNKTKNNIK